MKRFTILELLVVIAVIGILATILLPSLTKAQYSARLALCASNISQSGKGAFSYATQNNLKFPEQYDHKPYSTYILRDGKPYYNLGLINEQGYISPDVAFCPEKNFTSPHPPYVKSDYQNNSNRHNIIFSEQFNVQDGNIKKRPGESRCRSSYNFVLVQNRNGFHVPEFENNQILLMDNVTSKTRSNHKKYINSWNVMKIDGSLKLYKSNKVYALLENNSITQWKALNESIIPEFDGDLPEEEH